MHADKRSERYLGPETDDLVILPFDGICGFGPEAPDIAFRIGCQDRDYATQAVCQRG